MNGKLAQAVALVVFGKSFLKSTGDTPRLLPSHSTFKNVDKVRFVRKETVLGFIGRKLTIATNTEQWFLNLQQEKAVNIRLAKRPRYSASGDPPLPSTRSTFFAVEVECDGFFDLWVPSWKTSHNRTASERIWSVTYEVFKQNRSFVPHCHSLGEEAEQLSAALRSIRGFASEQKLDFWVKFFSEALDLLRDPDPVIPYHPDLLPEGRHSVESRRLLASAFKGWVFEGMGSWNDISFNDNSLVDAQRRVTQQLQGAVVNSIFAATNA
jgi:hypothetical protein